MKYLNAAIFLMLSFSIPAHQTAVRTPASEVRNGPVEEFVRKALELRERGDFTGALALLKAAQKIEPENVEVGYYIGLTLFDLGKFEDAETKLRDVLKIDPLYVQAKIILGRVLIAIGYLPESEKLLREAIAQSPDSVDAYDALASNLLAQKKTDEAIFILDLGLARKPEEASLLIKKAKIYFVTKKYKKSEEVARALTGNTNIFGRYQGHILLAKISFEENPMRTDLATPDLEEAIDLRPAETEAYLVLADVYVSMWKFEKARLVLEGALEEVKDRELIEKKILDIKGIEEGVLNFTVSANYEQWNFKDGRSPWQDFYLSAVWRIDPYKTLVFGLEKYSRGGASDESIRVEFIEKVNKWVYIYASAKVTVDPDFREESAFKLGTNFVINPLKTGATVGAAEAQVKNFENEKIFFLTAGVDQHIAGDSLIISARVFRVLAETENLNLWDLKTTWKLTPKLDVSANYGTMTEDIGGRPLRGTSKGIGAQYRLSDRVAVTGNYQRISNDQYRANQVSVGLRVSLGGSRKPTKPAPEYGPVFDDRPAPEPTPLPEVLPKPEVRRERVAKSAPPKSKEEETPPPVKKKKKKFFFFF